MSKWLKPRPAAAQGRNILMIDAGDVMGRIGKSYPRFEQAPRPSIQPEEAEAFSTVQVLGAIVGILSALCLIGLIGWLLAR